MIIDFFVHPEHPIFTGYANTEQYRRYLAHLQQILQESKMPVLVKGLEEGEFNKQFPKERVLESASHYIIDIPIDQGQIAPSEWERFTSIINQGNEYRVHGSYLGQCAQGFAVQLFAYLQRGEHWHNWRGMRNESESRIQEKLERKHEWRGDFRTSKVKYGTVIAPIKSKVRVRSPSWLFLIPQGNITHQLIDEKTVIY